MRGASEQQIVADYSSMQVKIPAEFWAELKERKLIEQDALIGTFRCNSGISRTPISVAIDPTAALRPA
jgi:hypothetical protein